MIISQDDKLTLIFESNLDDSGIIPAPVFGKTIETTNSIMHSVWDYALANPKDDRFESIREITYGHRIRSREIDFAVVGFKYGSLEIDLGLAIATAFGAGAVGNTVINLISSALWDLTKYGLGGIYKIIRSNSENEEELIDDPMVNAVLPHYVELVRFAHQSLRDGTTINTHFRYYDLEFVIDSAAQSRVIEANYLHTHVTTRLLGTLVGIDYSEQRIKIRFELFPDTPIWCDAQDLDIRQLNQFVLENNKSVASQLGFDSELFWRNGAAKVLPPDSIRIFRIVPPDEVKNPEFRGFPEFSRPSIGEQTRQMRELSESQIKFLQWFKWADENWDNPVMHGIVGYLRKRDDIIGSMPKQDIEKMIRSLINRGIILLVQTQDKNEPTLRLCRDHPSVIEILS